MIRLIPVFACALFFSCGGGSTGPKPLKHHFDDMYIAQVPLNEKQQVIAAQQEYSTAKMEMAKAKADLGEAKTKEKIAKRATKSSQLDVKTAKDLKKDADRTADMNKVNEAKANLHKAELKASAAKAKAKYATAQRKYLKAWLTYTKYNVYAKEATYEEAKARLAESRNIRPAKFLYKNYKDQETRRAKNTGKARRKADSELGKAKKAKKRWLKLERKAGNGNPVDDISAPPSEQGREATQPAAPVAPPPAPTPEPAPAPTEPAPTEQPAPAEQPAEQPATTP